MGASSISNTKPSPAFSTDSGWRWPHITYRNIEPIAILADALTIVAVCVICGVLFARVKAPNELLAWAGIGPIVCALFIPAAKLKNLYHPSATLSGDLHILNIAALWLGVVILLGVTAFSLGLGISPEAGIAFALVGLLGLLGHRAVCRLFIKSVRVNGGLQGRKILLISDAGASSHAGGVAELHRHNFRIEHSLHLGLMSDDASVRQRIDQAIALSINSDIDEIVIAVDVQSWPQLRPRLAALRQLPMPVSLIANGYMAELAKQPLHALGSSVLIEVQRPSLGPAERLAKRCMDLGCAAFGVLLLLPFMALVALLIKLDSSGPILFRQTRLGFNGKPFKIYKFRTMTVLEDGAEIRQATRDDDRVTNLGRWLRCTSIDELPQLFNVLKGNMSIVGPRPHAVAHDDQFERSIADYAFRRRMKPGITGWAQVNGYRGATPEVNLMDHRVRLDLYYIENWSIWLDVGIILRTVAKVVRGQNAY